MKVLGLTGSIGMGKSTLARQLRALRIPVHCADDTVHALLARDGAAYAAVATLFPETVTPNGIDRKNLGRIVLADDHKRRILESVLHPLVRQDSDAFVRAARRMGAKLCVLDIPLLFETDQADTRVDKILCATAPSFVQRRRVIKQRGVPQAVFEKLLSLQWPDAKKRAASDHIINTAQGRNKTMRALKRLRAILQS